MYVGKVEIGVHSPFFVIAGPCVLDTEKETLKIAKRLQNIQHLTETPIIFKASFDKANRSDLRSYRGPGLYEGLCMLREVRKQTGLPVITDIHEPGQANIVANFDRIDNSWIPAVDALQIPALLCRQIDLIKAAAKTGLPINIKKGQFMSPNAMYEVGRNCRQLCRATKFFFTERGHRFGYDRLINDMTAIPHMQSYGVPVVFDATHSTQISGQQKTTLDNIKDIPVLARSAVAAGANGLFLEVHPNPTEAKCDKACMLYLKDLTDLIIECKRIFNVVRRNQYGA